jgi:hypothetical protein
MSTHQLCANLLTIATTVRPSNDCHDEKDIEDPFEGRQPTLLIFPAELTCSGNRADEQTRAHESANIGFFAFMPRQNFSFAC